ncbi:hypothetical protein Bache_1625 [Bacteroides helcogenes P 36-108]|uniref:Uncharacterized protein n=1 Tax=Bacteroides helcogenes (strain ATCC 35417 / DSM 20613 / JCM 6297 / CCUG 15421 / P 36-108) TaxID=693979 RepID=E6SWS6_BACT6|nr:hypothetical protein Bache_1625 [Bacteroides helcogenes P 36-108]
MVNNLHLRRIICTDFTHIIKVSKPSKNNPPLCISKNEINKKE